MFAISGWGVRVRGVVWVGTSNLLLRWRKRLCCLAHPFGGFPKGYFCGNPYNKDFSNWMPILGSLNPKPLKTLPRAFCRKVRTQACKIVQ